MKKLLLALIIALSAFGSEATMHLKITGMMCPSCVQSVKGAISNVKGVKDVKVYLKDGKAEVKCDSSVTSQSVVDAVKNQGFGAEVVK
jgi:copper chaperone CopZ